LVKKWGKGGFHIFCWNFDIVKQATISLKGQFLKKNTGKMMLRLKLYFALINFEKPLFGGQ